MACSRCPCKNAQGVHTNKFRVFFFKMSTNVWQPMEDALKHAIINPESFHAAALMASNLLEGTTVLTAKVR